MSRSKSTLGELAFFQRGFDITMKQLEDGNYPVISSSGVQAYHSVAKVKGPGVIIGRKGTLGSVHYIESDFWPHDTTLWVKDFKGNNPKFVYYFLKTLELERFDSGGANPTLNRNHIHGLEIIKPSLGTQQRIADILSSYDRLIDNNNRRIALLEESIHQLYKEWFVRSRFPGYESVKIIDGIPEGWSKVPATQVIDFNPKTSAPKGEVRPYLPMEAVSTNSMIISEIDTRPVGGGAKFKNGDTLLARITPCLENGKTAFVQFIEDDNVVATGSTEFIVMRSTQVTPYWVYCLARSHNFRQHAINSMAGSDGRQRVKPDCFEQYTVLCSPLQILKYFDTIAAPIFKQIKYLNSQNQKLKEARDLLLPRLMNGSIAV